MRVLISLTQTTLEYSQKYANEINKNEINGFNFLD